MRVQKAGLTDQETLLTLMRESFEKETEASADEWARTKTAIITLLHDPHAGEAYLTFDEDNHLSGYIIMCRGFSLDYGGYFTWIEESYVRKSEKGRFRDQRFSP
jgi:hypothetical protein